MNTIALAEQLREVASAIERIDLKDNMTDDDGRAEAWSRIFSELHQHNRHFLQADKSGIESAVAEIRRLQSFDIRPVSAAGEPK